MNKLKKNAMKNLKIKIETFLENLKDYIHGIEYVIIS
jgi:predicted glycosyltransferase